jgi:rubredoxin-NAD+ reductase
MHIFSEASAPVVVIGAGIAAYSFVRELRRLDKLAPVAVVTADSGDYYYKPSLSMALAQQKEPQGLLISAKEVMARQLNATILAGTRVLRIDPPNRQIAIEDGKLLAYSRLVLATGASPMTPGLPAHALKHVLAVNDLDSYARFRKALVGGRSVVICGAGLIGCEFANDLIASGNHVRVIGSGAQPLPRLLPPEVGRFLRDQLARAGVAWNFGSVLTDLEPGPNGHRVTTSDGNWFEADLVMSAIGLSPNVQLARSAGLAVNRGIITDRALRTSNEYIHALGDCAEIDGQWLPYVAPILHSSKVVAANVLAGSREVTFPAMPVVMKTPACPTAFLSPAPGLSGGWEIQRTETGIKALHYDDAGRLTGFALSGGPASEKDALTRQLNSSVAVA